MVLSLLSWSEGNVYTARLVYGALITDGTADVAVTYALNLYAVT